MDVVATQGDLGTLGSFAAGRCAVTVEYIREHTTYGGLLTKEHPGVRVFWSALARLTQAELAEFYFFWTSMHPPRSGHTGCSYKITGERWRPSEMRLPIVAHTCFGSLDVNIDALGSENSALAAIKRTLDESRLLKSVEDP